ncbi:MAG: hypothetical protein ACYTDY_15200 [Planctomycetota bacterium]
MKKYFDRDIDDPLINDLVRNTDGWDQDRTARLLLASVKLKLT